MKKKKEPVEEPIFIYKDGILNENYKFVIIAGSTSYGTVINTGEYLTISLGGSVLTVWGAIDLIDLTKYEYIVVEARCSSMQIASQPAYQATMKLGGVYPSESLTTEWKKYTWIVSENNFTNNKLEVMSGICTGRGGTRSEIQIRFVGAYKYK